MVMTDPIADLLTRIRNANIAYHETLDIPASKVKGSLLQLLKDEGFIRDFAYIEDGKQGTLRLQMKYGAGKERVISGLKRISRPGLRVYERRDEIPRVLGGLGIAILSTSRGLMTDKQARQAGLGGEVVCYVW
jgi:small subunit ribosomal protein S8